MTECLQSIFLPRVFKYTEMHYLNGPMMEQRARVIEIGFFGMRLLGNLERV